MKINGKIETTGYLTVDDIDKGNCFTFQDEDELYYKTNNGIIKMATGEYYGGYDYYANKPVYRVDAEINIIKIYQ